MQEIFFSGDIVSSCGDNQGDQGVSPGPYELTWLQSGQLQPLFSTSIGMPNSSAYPYTTFVKVYYSPLIQWERGCALRLLQGDTVARILRPKFVLVSGTHTPKHSPTPGVLEAVLGYLPSFPLLTETAYARAFAELRKELDAFRANGG